MSDIDRAELRRLLAESVRPGEVFQVAYGHHYDYAVHDRAGWTVAECAEEHWVRLIAAAVNALPDLLDALDVAESAIERVRALHTPGDEWCGYHNSALCECANVYCEECGFSWPCPTIQALDGGE